MEPNRRSVLASIAGVSTATVIGSKSVKAGGQGTAPPEKLNATAQYKFDQQNTGRIQTTFEIPTNTSRRILFSPNYTNAITVKFPISTKDRLILGIETFGKNPSGVVSLNNSASVEWILETGNSISPPTVAGDHLFIGSDGLYATTTDGNLVWTALEEKSNVSSPKVADGSVYVTADKHAYSLNAMTGEVEWKVERGQGQTITPTLDENLVYVAGNSSWPVNGTVKALDTTKGTTTWTANLSGGVGAETVVDGLDMIVTDTNGTVYSLTAASGDTNWVTKIKANTYQSPVVSPSRVFIGTEGGIVYGLNKQNGEILWKYNNTEAISSEMTLVNETLLLVPSEDGVTALTPGGKEIWRSAGGGTNIHGSVVPTSNGQLAVGHTNPGETFGISTLMESS